MITLDRNAPLPIGEQLVEQLRYQIAGGKYMPGEKLPSTRGLADQLDISFHTVRKAYQRLAEEGVLLVRPGGGYFVEEPRALSNAERLERAADVVQKALRHLIGLGLTDEEMEMVFQEQLQFFERPGMERTLLFAAPFLELAESGAEHLSSAVQERVEGVPTNDLTALTDAEAVVTPLPLLQTVRQAVPNTDVVGVMMSYPHDVLEKVARLANGDTLALVTRGRDAIQPLTESLRDQTGFRGQILALTLDAERRQIERLVSSAALVLLTPQVRRRLRPLIEQQKTPYAVLEPTIGTGSLERVRELIGR